MPVSRYIIPGLIALSLSNALHANQAESEAAAISGKFIQTLGKTMKTTMKAEGPVAAIKVCRDLAPQIAGELSRQQGWQITRVSSRVRNPMLGTADDWQQQILAQFAQRLKDGEAASTIKHSEIVTETNGQYFRYMQAIPVGQPCLTCHGSDSDIPAPVKAILNEHYPHDQATGYQAGELRGAVSIKYPLP